MYEEEKDIRNKRKIILISDIDKKDHFYKKWIVKWRMRVLLLAIDFASSKST
jgi:hypothetical protein